MNFRLLLPALLLLLSPALPAAEFIDSFHSDIRIQPNGDLLVRETIRVHAEGKQIKRGIYRDFPTRYSGRFGSSQHVGFELLSVKRDGQPESYRSQELSNGIRIYIGQRNHFLDPGFYSYEIRYRTTRQIGFFDNYDELYWNVTGNGWTFEIRHATARVTLPALAENLGLTGYTGPQGSKNQNLEFKRLNSNQALFESTQALARNEGMTIIAQFPRGLVAEPSAAQKRAWFIDDNLASIIMLGGTLAVLAYYLLLWWMVGRDPASGIIIPLYRAPAGYSPASMRFVLRMGYDKTCFTSAVINLAVKGAIEIANRGSHFTLRKSGSPQEALAAGEREVLDGLFADGGNHVNVDRDNHGLLSNAIDRHRTSLRRDYETQYFKTNSWLILPGILVTLVVISLALGNIHSSEAVGKTVFLGLLILGSGMAIFIPMQRILSMGKNGLRRYGIFMMPPLALFTILFASNFRLTEYAQNVPLPVVIGMVAILAMPWFFYQWFKAPTLAGRRLLDRIEGFKHYLEMAEEEEIALQDAPEFSTGIYEKWLPYAIALDLENEWTQKLDRAVAAGLVESGYSEPSWYQSYGQSDASSDRPGFSRALAGSFNSAIAAASVAPGTSSASSGSFSGGGSSGGGSSGGGGGGGGGGGW